MRAIEREDAMSSNPLVLKLQHGAHIIEEGDRPDDVHLVLDGFACRYKMMPNGSRQIMALLVPGDFCDLHVAILGEMDHGIATLSPCTMVEIPRATILDMTDHHPRIARALWWASLVDEGVLREWIVNLGQRDAEHRMAHLFCELLVRLRAVGRADEAGYELPMTQAELGDVLAISNVHVNRTLQTLREAGLIAFKGQRLTIPDVERLKAYAEFTPNYLHLAEREDD
jgi:CRP-like cAMP-binding protein